ncbi:MAG: hypothetical protein AVDCRST_MAG69-1629 [uncultured Solirubrobacteraceae bacterium]|uniref:Uncharacterized protein n=1 Tax=uncultured Solirubrobacteraceae bacterium TaxID=1162706 RepID=A0A6J4SKN8_9ACTN|nr:MAG: hypothetical protein AVDCRST_MAG69-1629 [uncultured Solirubrobacteraceae bacterium]
MLQQSSGRHRSATPRPATSDHMTHVRTHHTTPSRSRGTGVAGPAGRRWRNPALARAAMVDFAV